MKDYQILTLKEKNITDFAKARNRLMKSAKSEWVLFLDTDEKLSDGLKKELENLDTESYSGFAIKRKIIFLGMEIGKDKVVRLVKQNSGKWVRAVHETWQTCQEIRSLDGYIIHNTAENLHDYIEKINIYSGLHAIENNKEGKRSNLLKIIFFPIIKFIQNIILGRGFVFSMLQSFHSFLSWSQEWILLKK
jgi:hypothetical protein